MYGHGGRAGDHGVITLLGTFWRGSILHCGAVTGDTALHPGTGTVGGWRGGGVGVMGGGGACRETAKLTHETGQCRAQSSYHSNTLVAKASMLLSLNALNKMDTGISFLNEILNTNMLIFKHIHEIIPEDQIYLNI